LVFVVNSCEKEKKRKQPHTPKSAVETQKSKTSPQLRLCGKGERNCFYSFLGILKENFTGAVPGFARLKESGGRFG
jgi:hypothetical protein